MTTPQVAPAEPQVVNGETAPRIRGGRESRLELCLLGAAPDTGNRGVSALCNSVLIGITRAAPDTRITVFDHGRGLRPGTAGDGDAKCTFERRGGYHTRRCYRAESWWQIRAAGWLGGLWNGAARSIAHADAVLDLSGGDSFSDLYGLARFRAVCMGKRAALEAGTPLVLLPQTYGPYRTAAALEEARVLVRRAAMAWARDAYSFENLAELLGADLDPERHRAGVDVAFDLPARRPTHVPETLARWLAERGTTPVVGLNVSGLLLDHSEAVTRYGLTVDYRELIAGFLRRLVEREGVRVVLVPHVLAGGRGECDGAASERIEAALEPGVRARVLRLEGEYDPGEAKWIISQCDFFCGTRMHSCIGALSSGVPVAGLAYSRKTRGVFASAGQEDAVADLRAGTTAEALDRLVTLWLERAQRRTALAAQVPAVVARARDQIDRILTHVRGLGRTR